MLYYATIPLTCKIQNRSQFLSRKPSTVSFNQPKILIYLFIKISSYLFNLLNIFIFLLLGHYHIAGLFQVPQQTVVPTREKRGPGQSYCAGLLIMLEWLIECLLLRIKTPEHTISLKITTTCPYQIAIKKHFRIRVGLGQDLGAMCDRFVHTTLWPALTTDYFHSFFFRCYFIPLSNKFNNEPTGCMETLRLLLGGLGSHPLEKFIIKSGSVLHNPVGASIGWVVCGKGLFRLAI